MGSFAKWTIGIVGGILGAVALLIAGVLLSGLSIVHTIFGTNPIGTDSESTNTQIVNALTRTEEVALISARIQGIEEKTGRTTFRGIDVPGSERATLLSYSFTAKMGIDGKLVKIEKTGPKAFTVDIPAFMFIGHDDVEYKQYESNGILSWVTPQIDLSQMTEDVLSADAQRKLVASNDLLLRDQAEAFYRGIARAIDPSISLDFEFLP